MADNFIEQTLTMSEQLNGQPVAPDEMAIEFAKMGVVERAQALGRIKEDLEATELSPRKAAQLHMYRSALVNMHGRLRDIGR